MIRQPTRRFCSTSSMSCAICGEALDQVRKSEYARLQGRGRRYIKGQKYTLLSRKENLTLEGKKALKTLLAANQRLNTAYLLKEYLRPAVELRARGLGAALLRELARQPQVAAAHALREVRRDDRSSLGRHRRLTPAGPIRQVLRSATIGRDIGRTPESLSALGLAPVTALRRFRRSATRRPSTKSRSPGSLPAVPFPCETLTVLTMAYAIGPISVMLRRVSAALPGPCP